MRPELLASLVKSDMIPTEYKEVIEGELPIF